MSDDDSVARYQRPPRKGQFKSGQSGNPRGRPKGSRNIRTYVQRLLDAPILVNENGKTRRMPRGEAIAIQLVNMAAKGDPKGLAAVMTLTRDYDSATGDSRPSVLSRAEDAAVMAGVIARIRAADPAPSPHTGLESSSWSSAEEPESSPNTDADIQRTIMEADWYRALFPTRLSARKAVNDFATIAGGVRMATSVGGVLTGRGADVIIIDDPLKPDQALSDVGRKAVNDWYDNTLLSRLNNKRTGCIIIVMQRLHQDDLVGHVLPQDDWTVLSFPAIAEEPECVPFETPYGVRQFVRQPGEALHPERESVQEYEAMRRRIGLYNFSSQYQQRPIPLGGNLVKCEWLRSYSPEDLPRRFLRIVQSWDTAAKTSELNDYSVCTTWGVDGDNYYLMDVFRRRLNYPDLKRAIVAEGERFRADDIVIEDKSSGTQLIQDLKNDGVLNVVEYKPPPGADKVMRLHACSDRFENGRVLVPANAPWLADYVVELIGFPGTKHDDQVDSTTQALDYLREPDLLATYLKAYS